MGDYNSKTTARNKVREAQQKVRDEREVLEGANIEDMATCLVSRSRLASVDQWEADRVTQVSAEASRRRDEYRTAAATALARIRDRGESITAIARLAETSVSDVRAYLKLAAVGGARHADGSQAAEPLCSSAVEVVSASGGGTENVHSLTQH
jgi:hypothetical protein